MTTEQPENDPYRTPGQSQPPPSSPGGGSPYGSTPPPSPPGGGDPYGGGAPPPPPGGGGPYGGGGGEGPGGHGGGGPGGPYDDPYGDRGGAADPLAGMPPLASRGKRLLARIIDALIIGIPVALVMGLIQGFDTTGAGDSYSQGGVYTLAYLVYEGLMLTRDGQTVGKKLMRVRVAMLANGAVPQGSPGWIRAVVYHVPPLVPCIGFLFWLVNVLFCTWDKPYQQCVHDKAAKTVVVATP